MQLDVSIATYFYLIVTVLTPLLLCFFVIMGVSLFAILLGATCLKTVKSQFSVFSSVQFSLETVLLVWQNDQEYEEEVILYQKRRNATPSNCKVFLFTCCMFLADI